LKGPGYILELTCLGWGNKFPSVAPRAVGATLEGCGGHALTLTGCMSVPSKFLLKIVSSWLSFTEKWPHLTELPVSVNNLSEGFHVRDCCKIPERTTWRSAIFHPHTKVAACDDWRAKLSGAAIRWPGPGLTSPGGRGSGQASWGRLLTLFGVKFIQDESLIRLRQGAQH
jgi:hypothetical protein